MAAEIIAEASPLVGFDRHTPSRFHNMLVPCRNLTIHLATNSGLIPFRDLHEPVLYKLGYSRHGVRVDLDAGKQVFISPMGTAAVAPQSSTCTPRYGVFLTAFKPTNKRVPTRLLPYVHVIHQCKLRDRITKAKEPPWFITFEQIAVTPLITRG